MFGADFYLKILPERVMAECHGRPGEVAVVHLHLGAESSLDLCHIVHLADSWLAVQHFQDVETCDDMDLAFLPYELVTMVTVSLHHPTSRRIGFSVGEQKLLPGETVQSG